MARPRQHDPEEVLLGLMTTFHELGYQGASFSDLEAATGLNRAQLSRTYGDKRQLFLKALEHTVDSSYADYLRPLTNGTVSDLRQMFRNFASSASTEQGRLGCLVCNTCRESVVMNDPDVQALVNKHFRHLESVYKAALRNSVALGELDLTPAEVRRYARLLYGTYVSMMVLLRAGESEPVLRDIANQAFRGLEPV